jgi:hypothetical protein
MMCTCPATAYTMLWFASRVFLIVRALQFCSEFPCIKSIPVCLQQRAKNCCHAHMRRDFGAVNLLRTSMYLSCAVLLLLCCVQGAVRAGMLTLPSKEHFIASIGKQRSSAYQRVAAMAITASPDFN